MIDNLTEAITHAREVAKEIRQANEEMPNGCKLSENLCECASEHEQLAAWLEELAEYRKLFKSPKEAEEALHRREECREFISKCHVPTHRKEEKE